jgi:FtsP/CotA-like multicopper oxidase with cupredoxin domain
VPPQLPLPALDLVNGQAPAANWTGLFKQAMDRSGFARGTLAVREGLSAPVPPMDPIFSRTMTDMGMSGMSRMQGMDMKHSSESMEMPAMKGMLGMEMAAMGHAMGAMPGMPPGARLAAPINASGQIAYPQPQDVHLKLGPAVVNIAMSPRNGSIDPATG